MRARGLKLEAALGGGAGAGVAPHAGAWVETGLDYLTGDAAGSRAPCGRVG